MACLLSITVPGSVVVYLTIFLDCVKVEADQYAQRKTIGWFKDEVSALSAVCERSLMQSAILPELRKLPPMSVQCEYRITKAGHEVERWRRGTVTKSSSLGRRVVLLPGARQKCWLATPLG